MAGNFGDGFDWFLNALSELIYELDGFKVSIIIVLVSSLWSKIKTYI